VQLIPDNRVQAFCLDFESGKSINIFCRNKKNVNENTKHFVTIILIFNLYKLYKNCFFFYYHNTITENSTISFLYHYRTFNYIIPLSPQNIQIYRSFITTEHSTISFLYHLRTFRYIVPLSPQNSQLYHQRIVTGRNNQQSTKFIFFNKITLQ
jgi:hypothetical protein